MTFGTAAKARSVLSLTDVLLYQLSLVFPLQYYHTQLIQQGICTLQLLQSNPSHPLETLQGFPVLTHFLES